MATTTNYGWTTPDDTALVKDGASAIRTLGSSVDTTTKNLNPETTLGDIAYRSSSSNTNTRLGIGSSGQVLTVAAGVPSWANAFSNPLTTTGDTIYSSSGSTAARLGIGTTGQVLAVSGGVPAWTTVSSGGMTLITTTTYDDTVNTYTYSSLGSYKHLLFVAEGATTSATGSIANIGMYFNGVNTGNAYNTTSYGINGTTFHGESNYNNSSYALVGYRGYPNKNEVVGDRGQMVVWLYDYAGSGNKTFYAQSRGKATTNYAYSSICSRANTDAITSVTIFTENTNNFFSGTLKLYGVS